MSKACNISKTQKEKRRKMPKVRSWIRRTLVHTPRPKKKIKHPKREFEREWHE